LLDLRCRERHLANGLGLRVGQRRPEIAIAPAREAAAMGGGGLA